MQDKKSKVLREQNLGAIKLVKNSKNQILLNISEVTNITSIMISHTLLKESYILVHRFILTPGQLDPRGSRYPRAAWPPGVKISRGIFTPALIFTPGGEDTMAWASWPPPSFNFLNFEKSQLIIPLWQ